MFTGNCHLGSVIYTPAWNSFSLAVISIKNPCRRCVIWPIPPNERGQQKREKSPRQNGPQCLGALFVFCQNGIRSELVHCYSNEVWKVCGDQHSWILLGHTRLVSKEIVSHVKRRMLKLDYYFNLLIWSAMAIRCRWSVPQQPPKTLTVHFGLVPRLRQILPIVCPYSKGSPLSRVELSSNSSWLFVDPLPRRALFPFKQTKKIARKCTKAYLWYVDPGDPGLLNVKQVFEPWRVRAFDGIIGRRFFACRVQCLDCFLCNMVLKMG